MKWVPVLLVFLLGCNAEETRVDASAEPRSQSAIGVRYVVVGKVDAYGVRRHSKAPVEYITLIPPPGAEGSEIGFRVPVRLGTTLTVRKVIRTNRLSHPMAVMVDLDGTPLPVSAPVSINFYNGNEGDSYLELNPAIYRKLAPASS